MNTVETPPCVFCNSGWEIILGKESFCSWCGHSVKGFRIEAEESAQNPLFYVDEAGPFLLQFKIVNVGLVPIEIHEIKLM